MRFFPTQALLRVLRSGWFYALVSAVVTLCCARSFYRSMWLQTGGIWSAPLDDVFIHLDFARQTARGHWLEWAPGNGYSSGATSPLYVLVLALAFWLGAHGSTLLQVAAMLAMVGCFCGLYAYRQSFLAEGGSRLGLLAVPPLFYAVGALDWALWSGMEVALFLTLHAFALWIWARLVRTGKTRYAASLAVFGVALTATRPEAISTLFAFALLLPRRISWTTKLAVFAPAVAYVFLTSVLNRTFTGESAAYGALVKVAWYNPTLSLEDKWLDYQRNFRHVVGAVFRMHVGNVPYASAPLVALGLLPLGDRKHRRLALLLWLQVIAWFLLISCNNQVRWQNERYAMPAVAWILVLSGYGVACAVRARRAGWLLAGGAGLLVLLGSWGEPSSSMWGWAAAFVAGTLLVLAWSPARPLAVVTLVVLFANTLESNIRTQRWFFGRACKNILEQQVTVGDWLRRAHLGKRGRVLVGDAGAILYASDWHGLDLIGLGGYRDLPFARAGALGLGASLELLERIPERERPEYLAIFPSWWETLPLFFSKGVVRRFPIRGNVICGDFEHVVYEADWRLLGTGDEPRGLPPGRRVLDVLDTGDLVSEREHAHVYEPLARNGKAHFKILRDAEDRDLFDGGRRLVPGSRERLVLRGAMADKPAYVSVRTAPEGQQRFVVRVRSKDARLLASHEFSLQEVGAFVESELRVEPPVPEELEIEIEVLEPGEFVNYHMYLTQ